jgi:erythromycin esterase-like protein
MFMSRRFFNRQVPTSSADVQDALAKRSQPLGDSSDLDPLLERVGDARFVLLGEASHGTSEYYEWRTLLSQRLIEEKGFSFIAVEGDWPDCYRVNRFVRGLADDGESAREVLHAFDRWPTWMWANEEVVRLVTWLSEHNDAVASEQRVGFYGLDVYSLWDSLYQVMGYVQRSRPELRSAARRAFECLEPYGEDAQNYAVATRWADESCEDAVVDLLTELRRAGRIAGGDHETQLDAEQNAWVVASAEEYYRTMVRGGSESWNVRDRHMAATLERLMQAGPPDTKAIVWEHNTHIGDARYTDMADDSMVNVGQLVRENHSESDAVLVGFSTYQGSVIASRAWDAPYAEMRVPMAEPGSWDEALHLAAPGDKLVIFDPRDLAGPLAEMRGQRAIGVVYHPEREGGNYVPTVLPRRYDALLFLDETHALRPLHEVQPRIVEEEAPETFPTGV